MIPAFIFFNRKFGVGCMEHTYNHAEGVKNRRIGRVASLAIGVSECAPLKLLRPGV